MGTLKTEMARISKDPSKADLVFFPVVTKVNGKVLRTPKK